MDMELLDLHKSKQGNTTNLNIFFLWKMKKELRWDSNMYAGYISRGTFALPWELACPFIDWCVIGICPCLSFRC